MNREIKFRAWIDYLSVPFMAVQGTPDLETLFSFMFHYGEEEKLMQFTGLKDKNGIEIYEGDVLRFITNGFDSEMFITTVIFDKAGFKLQNNRSLFYFGQSDFTKVDDATVIGNIYENPELLTI